MVQEPIEGAKTPPAASDWGVGPPESSSSETLVPIVAIVIVSALLGVVMAAFLAPLAGVTVAVLCILALIAWVWAQPRFVLSATGARPLKEGEHPRLANVARGLAADLGMRPPSIRLIEGGEPNALASHAGGPVIAISTSFLEILTRTELEGVVAHTLLRTPPRVVKTYGLAAALGPLTGPRRRLIGSDDDLRTCAVTRYPPALAAAIGKAAPIPGRRAVFWFVGGGDTVASAAERIEALEDL